MPEIIKGLIGLKLNFFTALEFIEAIPFNTRATESGSG